MLKNMLCALGFVVGAFALAGCGGGAGCMPAVAANSMACGAAIFIDASTSDPVCLASGGEPLCRGDMDAVCYHCNGGTFTDGCIIKTGNTVYECVHSCDKC